MFKNKKIVVIIPARGGSKGIPRKNIKLLGGKPLISYAIQAARRSRYVDHVVVSTDDHAIARVAEKYGAEVPFMRPAHLATDTAPMVPVLQHALHILETKERYSVDIMVLVQPTSPFVHAQDIDHAIRTLVNTRTTSCVSVCEINDRPEWMFVTKRGRLIPFLKRTKPGGRRQDLPTIYRLNGAVYVARRDLVMKKNRLIDQKTSFILMPKDRSIDIDEPIDFKLATALL